MTNAQLEKAIAHDLDLCDLGIALTTGRRKAKFVKQRAACFAALKELNKAEGLDKLTDDELLKSLTE